MPNPPLFPAWLRLLALLAALLCAAPALARIAGKDDPVTLQQTWNPKPDALDIVLPMPCGLSMAFRAVAVSGEPGQEFPFMMGLQNADRERRIYGERREGRIAGVFTANDLPIAWRTLLEKSEWQGHTVYLMGKYEVSQAQWDAVMNESCPAPEPPKPGRLDKLRGILPGKKQAAPAAGADLPASAALPAREISWGDMQNFLTRYNQWLRNQPHALPRFVDNAKKTGFVRLPTETEWEFAARGGMAVSKEERERDFFLQGRKQGDYAVFSAEHPEPIGSRLPNALGLYDTAGNVKELMDNAFQRGGSTGGVIVKGGGFRSGKDDVLPGWRDEANRYNKPNDQGFRLVLTGELTASARRMEHLNALNPDVERARLEAERRRAEQEKARAAQAEVEKARRDAAEQTRLAQEQTRAAEEKARHAELELEKMRQQAAEEVRRAAEQAKGAEQRALAAQQEQERLRQVAAEEARKAAEQAREAEQRALAARQEQERQRQTAAEEARRAAQQEHERLRQATAEEARRVQAERDNTDAQFKQGMRYYEGRGVPRDYRQAAASFRKVAEQGHAEAQFYLGEIYSEGGRGVREDVEQAVEWYRMAAEQGHPVAQGELGMKYLKGRGVSQNYNLAWKWCRNAFENLSIFAEQSNNANAQSTLAGMYLDGCGLSQNDLKAAKWYRKAAEQGNASAQNNLAWMYMQGRGSSKNDYLAVEWFQKAVEQGNIAAQNNLAYMYQEDRGVPQDDRLAVQMYRQAAEQGNASAMFNLGWMYQRGRGVPQSYRLAVEWYNKAVVYGNSEAQQALRQMEMQGRGW